MMLNQTQFSVIYGMHFATELHPQPSHSEVGTLEEWDARLQCLNEYSALVLTKDCTPFTELLACILAGRHTLTNGAQAMVVMLAEGTIPLCSNHKLGWGAEIICSSGNGRQQSCQVHHA